MKKNITLFIFGFLVIFFGIIGCSSESVVLKSPIKPTLIKLTVNDNMWTGFIVKVLKYEPDKLVWRELKLEQDRFEKTTGQVVLTITDSVSEDDFIRIAVTKLDYNPNNDSYYLPSNPVTLSALFKLKDILSRDEYVINVNYLTNFLAVKMSKFPSDDMYNAIIKTGFVFLDELGIKYDLNIPQTLFSSNMESITETENFALNFMASLAVYSNLDLSRDKFDDFNWMNLINSMATLNYTMIEQLLPNQDLTLLFRLMYLLDQVYQQFLYPSYVPSMVFFNPGDLNLNEKIEVLSDKDPAAGSGYYWYKDVNRGIEFNIGFEAWKFNANKNIVDMALFGIDKEANLFKSESSTGILQIKNDNTSNLNSDDSIYFVLPIKEIKNTAKIRMKLFFDVETSSDFTDDAILAFDDYRQKIVFTIDNVILYAYNGKITSIDSSNSETKFLYFEDSLGEAKTLDTVINNIDYAKEINVNLEPLADSQYLHNHDFEFAINFVDITNTTPTTSALIVDFRSLACVLGNIKGFVFTDHDTYLAGTITNKESYPWFYLPTDNDSNDSDFGVNIKLGISFVFYDYYTGKKLDEYYFANYELVKIIDMILDNENYADLNYIDNYEFSINVRSTD